MASGWMAEPDYAGNQEAVDSTTPVSQDTSRLASSRSYDPMLLPRYKDTVKLDERGDPVVVRSAESKYSVAIPKVRGALSDMQLSGVPADFSPAFIRTANRGFLYSHTRRHAVPPECFDEDIFSPQGETCRDPSVPEWVNDPLVELPNAGNCYCKEGLASVPHFGDHMVNPYNGTSNADVKGGEYEGGCLGKHPNVDRTGEMADTIAKLGLRPKYWAPSIGGWCGYEADDTADPSKCIAECPVSGKIAGDPKIKYLGPAKMAKVGMLICPKSGPPYMTERTVPTELHYEVCFPLEDAEIDCVVATEYIYFSYAGFPWCSWLYGFLAKATYEMKGEPRKQKENEAAEGCGVFSVGVNWDQNGCPSIGEQNWIQVLGHRDGHFTMPEGLDFSFKLVPKSQLPSNWTDSSDGKIVPCQYFEELYPTMQFSSIHRFRKNGGRA